MANFEYVNDVGSWFFHALIESSKLDRMSSNEEANHQNKPRTCDQFEATYKIGEDLPDDVPFGLGSFETLAHLEPESTALLFGVHVLDTDAFGGTDVGSEFFLFPTGPGLGPFLRPPIMALCPSAFTIPDASSGRDWQAAVLAAATNETGAGDWLLVQIGQPHTSSGFDNFRNGIQLDCRIAGFDGVATGAPPVNSSFYVFWHVVGSVAAYS